MAQQRSVSDRIINSLCSISIFGLTLRPLSVVEVSEVKSIQQVAQIVFGRYASHSGID